MLRFREGDIVLVGAGSCGREALRDARRGSRARFYLFEGVETGSPLTHAGVIRADLPGLVGGQLFGAAGSRVFLAGELPRIRVQNLQLLGGDPLLLAILLGSAGAEAAPLGEASIRALEEGCRNSGYVPTALEDALEAGTIRHGHLAGPPLSHFHLLEMEGHLAALLAHGGEGVAFAARQTLIEPSRPRTILRHINESSFGEDDAAALVWAPPRGSAFQTRVIDEALVQSCADHQIRTIFLGGSEVIPTEAEAIASACDRLRVCLHRSCIGD